MEKYTRQQIEEGIGLYTDRRTKIGKLPGGEYVTTEINTTFGPDVEVVGYADENQNITWL